MSSKKDPTGQFIPNQIIESIKAFGVIPAVFGTLIDLGTDYSYTHFLVTNSLDNDVVIKFGTNEITFKANKDIWIDNFIFNDIIEYKYKTLAPTVGDLQVICY